MKNCVIELRDEVNCKILNLDLEDRKALVKEFEFLLPHARFTPAFKLGRWNGKVSFFNLGGTTYINILDKIVPILVDRNYNVSIKDLRVERNYSLDYVDENFFDGYVWPDWHDAAGEPIMLRDYQVECVNKFVDDHASMQEICTGAGKTLMTAAMTKIAEKYGKIITIVPSQNLVLQTEATYKAVGIDVGVYYASRKELDKKHLITTWQSLESLNKAKTKHILTSIAGDTAGVIVDEAHGAKATVLKAILTTAFKDVSIRWGITGTIPKEEHDKISLTIAIGDVVHKLPAKRLQDAGKLSNCHIDVLQTVNTEIFEDYTQEYTWLIKNTKRLKWTADKIEEQRKKGNTLVFVDRIEHGKALQDLIPDSYFISGALSAEKRKEIYDKASTEDGLVFIATTKVAAVGIDIPRIFNLFLIEIGKSFIKVIQGIGRGIRKAGDKDFVNIFDICSTCKYSKKHLTERKKYYKDAEYPFKIHKISL